ncbi:MAG: exodeoxyribonuclease III [Candidatus Cloacimonadales bacterium]
MKIISWNVNGLRAVVKKNFLQYLAEEEADIIGLQETKLQETQIPSEIMELEGYHKYWNSAQKKGYSGVALFSKKEPLHVSFSLGEERFDAEGRTIIAEYQDFVLINCYFPNGQRDEERLQYKLDFYDRMLEVMNGFVAQGKNIVVCGDYNTAHKEIDLKNPQANSKLSGFLPIEREWLDKIVAEGYIDTFRVFHPEPEQYSWWTYRFGARKRNAGWRIDYFFINQDFLPQLQAAFIQQDVMGSDHCPVGVVLDV